jgi:hypothetical protein
MFLHYKLTAQADVSAARKMSSNANAGPDLEPITELDVIYGGKDVKPLFSFTKVSTMITGGHDDDQAVGVGLGKGKRVGTSLAYRRDSKSTRSDSRLPGSFIDLIPIFPDAQSYHRRRHCDSRPQATSLSSKSPTSTSASVLAHAVVSSRHTIGPREFRLMLGRHRYGRHAEGRV